MRRSLCERASRKTGVRTVVNGCECSCGNSCESSCESCMANYFGRRYGVPVFCLVLNCSLSHPLPLLLRLLERNPNNQFAYLAEFCVLICDIFISPFVIFIYFSLPLFALIGFFTVQLAVFFIGVANQSPLISIGNLQPEAVPRITNTPEYNIHMTFVITMHKAA